MAKKTAKKTVKKSTKKPAKSNKSTKRQIRFSPDPTTTVLVNFDFSLAKDATVVGIVLNESQSGFAALFHTEVEVTEGMDCFCRVGQLADTVATVRWRKVIDENIVKIGFEYLE